MRESIDDAADSDGGRGAQFVDRRRASVQDDPGRIDTGRQCDRQLAGGADADTHTLLRDAAGHVGGQQRLCGIDHFDAGQCGAAVADAMAKVGFVENIGGRAEFVGYVGQGHISDAESTQLVDACRRRPDRGVYSRRRGAVKRGQMVEHCHTATVRRRFAWRTTLDGLLTVRRRILTACRSDVLDGLDAEVPVGDQCCEGDVAFREAPRRHVAAVHHRDHAGDDGADGRHSVEGDLG